MARIAIGGFQHETNTFSPIATDYRHFQVADGWPPLSRGQALFEAVAGVNLPIEGFISAVGPRHQLVPLLWCSAEPAAHVTQAAFERIAADLLSDLRRQGPVDAVYLDLHGAMVTTQCEDGEGEILSRIRRLIGPETPLVASLDFHANLTEQMVRETTALTIYRTYPHVDMAATGARAAELLMRTLAGERIAGKALRKADFLIPLQDQCTLFEPNRSLYGELDAAVPDGSMSADLALGFPPADIHDCGPGLVTYAATQAASDSAADALMSALDRAEACYESRLFGPDDAVRRAMDNGSDRPVVLADTQDNSGAGGTGDTTGILAALVHNGARGALVAVIADPAVAAQAHAAGVGADIAASLGGKSGVADQPPFVARFRVEALGDGHFTCTGPVYLGSRCALGPMALLRVLDDRCDVAVIVSTQRFQALDQAVIRHLGVEPARQRILALKSSVHFRADFDPITAATLVVVSPGSNPADPRRCDYQRLREGIRLAPNGPAFRRG